MGRKAKSKNRKGRAASTGPPADVDVGADADLPRRESDAGEFVGAAGSSGASSLVGDEDGRPSAADQAGAVIASAADNVAPPTAEEPTADDFGRTDGSAEAAPTSGGVVEAPQTAAADVADVAQAAERAEGTDIVADEAFKTEDAVHEALGAPSEATESHYESAAEVVNGADGPDAGDSSKADEEVDPGGDGSEDVVRRDGDEEGDAAGLSADAAIECDADASATAVGVNEGPAPQVVAGIDSQEVAVEQRESETTAVTEVVAFQEPVETIEPSEVSEPVSGAAAELPAATEQHTTETTVVSEVVAIQEPVETIESLQVPGVALEASAELPTAVEQHTTETAAAAEEFTIQKRQATVESSESVSEVAAELHTAVEQHTTQTAVVAEVVAIQEPVEAVVSTKETAAEHKHTKVVEAATFAPEELHTAVIMTSGELEAHQDKAEAFDTTIRAGDEAEGDVAGDQAGTVEVDETAMEEHHADSMEADDAVVEALRIENPVTTSAAVEEPQVMTVVSENDLTTAQVEPETVMGTEDVLVVENHAKTVEIGSSTERQSQSHTEGSTEATVNVLEVSETVAVSHVSAAVDFSSADHDSANGKRESPVRATNSTQSRPMLTTERSFVMEDDHTVKADDTVVVSERVSTDGEEDFEDATPPSSEGFQAAAIANSMSMMRPVLDKRRSSAKSSARNGTIHQSASSLMAPTASSTARRSSDDYTPNATPPRVRSRSSSRHSTPDVKSPAAASTVLEPPRRASAMAPTASYAAKHQADDAPKKALARTHSSEAKPEVSDTGFIKPPPAPVTVPVPPKRASIMAPTASYAAKHHSDVAPKKTPPRARTDKHAKPEVSDTGFVKPPPAPPTVPVRPKRASIMAPTASSAAKRGHGEEADAAREAKAPPRPRRSLSAKPEVSDTGFVKPPPPPPTVPVRPKRASIMAPTASSAAKRGGPDVSADEWSRDTPPKPAARSKAAEFVPTVPVAPKRASLMAPTASSRAKTGPEAAAVVEAPPPVETKPLYRNKRYANVQSKVLGMMTAPTKKAAPRPAAVEEPKQSAPAPRPAMFKSKRYANVQSKIKDWIHSGPSQPDASALERRRSLGASAKRDAELEATARRRSSLAGSSALRGADASGSGSDLSDPFAQALAARAHKKKLRSAVPRYLSYEQSGVYAQRAQAQQERRRRLEELNKDKSQTRQHQLRVVLAEKLHVNYDAQKAEHSQAALGNVGARARRSSGSGNANGKTRGSRSSSASDEVPEAKAAPLAIAGGVFVVPSDKAVVETVVETLHVDDSDKVDDGVTKRINFDDMSDEEEEEQEQGVAVAAAVRVADVA